MVRGLGVFDVRLFGEMLVLFGGSSSIFSESYPETQTIFSAPNSLDVDQETRAVD
jgi:hypothetical protein